MSSRDKVLIVEDEESLRELLRMILEGNGIKVLQASDGMEAVAMFKAHKDEIGVVLSDLGLPLLGGWEAFLMMKEINPEVKGILASGYYNPDVRTDIIKSGANDFIQKPYNSVQIVAMIRNLLDEKK
jgi:two-component system, cell cycle sensor histidine kinase and response regulator CckA